MACGGFTCSRYALAILNVIYIMVAFLLIGVAAYGKAVAMIATLQVLGGIIGCGVFLLLISIVGLIGAIKHHQVLLFFYMIILFLLFLVQFSVACACLAVTDAQQRTLFKAGWESANPALKNKTQIYFNCCGLDKDNQDKHDGPDGHPSCNVLKGSKCQGSTAACCQTANHTSDNQTSNNSTISTTTRSTPSTTPVDVCPYKSCLEEIEPSLHEAAKVAGGLGLFFAFTELFAVWLTVRYRNFKDHRINPRTFL